MLNIDNMNRWEVYELMKKEYMATGVVVDIPALLREISKSRRVYEEAEEAMEGYREFKSVIGHYHYSK